MVGAHIRNQVIVGGICIIGGDGGGVDFWVS